MINQVLTLLLVLGGGLVAYSQTLSCDDAITYHEFALNALQNCSSGDDNSTLCELIGDYEQQSGSQSDQQGPSPDDQLSFLYNPVPSVQPWQDYLTQNALTSVSDPGEISYIINTIKNSSYASISGDAANASITNYYGNWQQAWWSQADNNLALAANPDGKYDNRAVQTFYWKAANYLFTGNWPLPFGEQALARSVTAAEAFRSGLEANPAWTSRFFSVPFNNGTATAQLPGIFVSPDGSRQLPTIVLTTGTDFTKEETFLQFALEIIARGYAVVVYEGPGQGPVLKSPPNMPFYADWGAVLSVILDYVEDSLADVVQLDKVVQYGVSLGGYLGSRGCAANSDRLAACVPNPPQYSVIPVYDKFSTGLAEGVYGPIQYAAQTDATSLPDGYAAVFQDPLPIITTLLLTCTADTAAPDLIFETFYSTPGVIDPELVYLAGGYGGIVAGDEDVLYDGLWQAFRNVQAFGQYNVSDITTPVVAVKGTEDDLLGGQEEDWFSQLSPETQSVSTLITFDETTGGALHCQVGAPLILANQIFSVLDPILKGTNSSSAAASSPARLPTLPSSTSG